MKRPRLVNDLDWLDALFFLALLLFAVGVYLLLLGEGTHQGVTEGISVSGMTYPCGLSYGQSGSRTWASRSTRQSPDLLMLPFPIRHPNASVFYKLV